MRTGIESLLSIGELVSELGVPLHRIQYLLRSRGLKPTARAGNAFVYGPDTLARLQAELERRRRQDQKS